MLKWSEEEQRKAKDLFARAETNLRALELFSRYLNYCPRFVEKQELEQLAEDAGISQEKAYSLLMGAACGLDGAENPEDRELERRYFPQGIRCLSAEEIRRDPYYAAVQMPKAKQGGWEFGYKRLEAYEAFPSDDPLCMPDGR